MVTGFDAVRAALSVYGNVARDGFQPEYLVGPASWVDVKAIAKVGEHTVLIVPDCEQFTLRLMYLDADEFPHWSRQSVGGVVEPKRHGSIEAAITHYNNPTTWEQPEQMVPITDLTYL